MPTDSARAFDGTCSAAVAAVVCASGVCESDNKCGAKLLLKYDFEDGQGTTVTDLSGNGYNGMLQNVGWTSAGRNTNAATFADTASAVQLPEDLLADASTVTISTWVYLTAKDSGARLFDFGTASNNSLYFTVNNGSSGMNLVATGDGGITQTLTVATQLPLNVWKHVTVTIGGGQASIFIDGQEVARRTSFAFTPSSLGESTDNLIGRSSWDVTAPALAGTVDEFYVYGRVLPLAEIRQNAWPKTDYSIWHFDETSGTTAKDSSDNAMDGTLVHSPTFETGVIGNGIRLTNASNATASTGQYVSLPHGIVQKCTNEVTIATWINLATASYAQMRVFDFTNASTHKMMFGRTKGGSTEAWAFGQVTGTTANGGVGYANMNRSTAWPTTQWFHVAIVQNTGPNGQVASVYVNGRNDTPGFTAGTTVQTANLASTYGAASTLGDSLTNYIGAPGPLASEASGGSYFNGTIDELLISCRAYTMDELTNLATRF